MLLTPQNLIRHELCGLKAKVAESTDPTMRGVFGTVIDETYNTLKIETKKMEKVIPKANTVFIFTLPNGVKVKVDGELLVSRPEDRIKKRLARW